MTISTINNLKGGARNELSRNFFFDNVDFSIETLTKSGPALTRKLEFQNQKKLNDKSFSRAERFFTRINPHKCVAFD